MAKSKLLQYLQDKPVIITYTGLNEEIEATTGILVDMDDEHYYIGGDNHPLFAISKHCVKAIIDASDAIEGFDDEKDILQ